MKKRGAAEKPPKARAPSKFIQIAAVVAPTNTLLFALDDTGRIWRRRAISRFDHEEWDGVPSPSWEI
jgi:hypothetical protein